MTAPTGGLGGHMQQPSSHRQGPFGSQPSQAPAQTGHLGTYGASAARPQEGFATGYAQQMQPQDLLPRTRIEAPQGSMYDRAPAPDRRTERAFLEAPLSFRTASSNLSMPEPTHKDRAGSDSPSRQMYPIPSLGASSHSFSMLRQEPKSLEELNSSPRAERLPSFRQLSKIADGATDVGEARITPFPSSSTYPPSIVHQSSNSYFPASQQSSPSTSYLNLSHQSPGGSRGEGHDRVGASPSPAAFPDANRYDPRARSFTGEKPPAFVTSHTSSSNETVNSRQSSAVEGYSSTHTTPIETASSVDGTPKPMLPLPHGMQAPIATQGIFVCDYPGCTAAPFQTQYLLK